MQMSDFLGRSGVPPGALQSQQGQNYAQQQQSQLQLNNMSFAQSQQQQLQQQQLQRMQQQQGNPQQQQPNFQSVSQQQQQNQQRMGGAGVNPSVGLPGGMRQQVIGGVGGPPGSQVQPGLQSQQQRTPLTLQQQQQQQQSNTQNNPFQQQSSAPLGSGPPGPNGLLGMQQGGQQQGGGFQSEILQSMMKQGGAPGGYTHSAGGLQSSSLGGLGGLNGQLHDSQQGPGQAPRFDMLSDFPALSDLGGDGKLGGMNSGNVGGQGSGMQTTLAGQLALNQHNQQSQNQGQSEAFVIQNEDFPALGGGGGAASRRAVPAPTGGATASLLQQRAVGQVGAIGQGGQNQPAGSTAATVAQQQQQALNQPPTQPRSGMPRPQKAQTCDKYGLTGLLPVIRMTDPDLTTLALGTDLTTLGLNLNSSEVLYATFSAPCLDVPTRSEPDYVLPFAYYMQPPALKTSHLAKFTLETLFYIFYNMPKDTLQVYAAKELYKREWRYHKELKLWFSRAANATAAGADKPKDPAAKDDANTYLYFDINAWSALKWEGPVQRMLVGLDMDGYDEDWTSNAAAAAQRKANETSGGGGGGGTRTEGP